MQRTYAIGVGMTKFDKPGAKAGDYPDWVHEAGTAALTDAGVAYDEVQEVHVGYCYGDSTAGQRAVYTLGETGVPITNVNNNCATGSTALFLARRAVRSGLADVALAVGFEKMERGSLGMRFADRTPPLDRHLTAIREARGWNDEAPFAPQMFGTAGQEHMQRHGSRPEHFAWVAWKNHRHSTRNPYAQFQQEHTPEEIASSREIFAPLTKLQCSPTSDGAAAVLVASERFIDERGLRERAVELAGQALVTDTPASFGRSAIDAVGFEMSRLAATRALAEADARIADVDVIELHDCFSTNEVLTYEAIGIAEPGRGHELVEREATTYGGGGPVVNPSGGLISKGHPLGATGLAQCAELTWQLRGEAGERQVDGARLALQHNIGLGGAAVVGVLRRADDGS